MRITRGRIGLLAVVLAAMLGLALLARPRPTTVETASVRRGALRVTVDEEGRTRVHDRFQVTSPVTGRLQRIALHEGDRVRAGQVVAHMAPAPLDEATRTQGEARLRAAQELERSARSRVAEARAALDQERRFVVRQEALLAAGAIADESMERAALSRRKAEEELAAASAQARAAAADVAAARAALLGASTRDAAVVPVRSPATGRVLRVHSVSEGVVPAGTPLIELGDPGAIEIVVDVLSTDAVRLRPGAAAEIVDWGGDRPLQGRIRTIEPSGFTKVSALGVDEQRVNVIVDAGDDARVLGDGYRVEVRLLEWEKADALLAPSSAVFEEQGRWASWVVSGGRVHRREVRVGHRGSGEVEILGGLQAGDAVVLFPSDAIREGMRVKAEGKP